MLKILVAVDGSDYSKKALSKAKDLASVFKSDVTILNVTNLVDRADYYSMNRYDKTGLEKALERESGLLLENAKQEFEGLPIKVETIKGKGDPSNEIIKLAEEGGFDLIVMGSRGLGVFSRTLLGSVSDKVTHHANLSVLIVK